METIDKEINHSSNISDDISRLFLNERLSDVLFIVDGKQIVGHKAVLAIRSQTFMQMFFGPTVLTNCKREIHIKDCSALSFKNFMKYLYTGRLTLIGIDKSEVQELLDLALKHGINQLVNCLLEQNTVYGDHKSANTVQPIGQGLKPSADVSQKPKILSPLRFEDIANVNNGATVIEGLNPQQLLATKKDLDERSLTKHKLEFNTKGIVVRLNIPVIVNLIKIRLLDVDPKRYYCYYIQVSSNNIQWQTVCDHRYYSCRSWQSIFFDQRLVQFIRIVGTNSNEKTFFSNSRYFTIISLYCGLTQRPPKMYLGFWEPEINCASIGKGAIVIINNGNDYCRTAKMINDSVEFEYKKYNHIYSEFHFDKTSELIVHLSQPVITSSINFYIYGEEKFKYTVRVTADPIDKEVKNWILVSDRRKQFNSSKWQRISFNKTKVVLICIANIRCLDETVTTFPILTFSCP